MTTQRFRPGVDGGRETDYCPCEIANLDVCTYVWRMVGWLRDADGKGKKLEPAESSQEETGPWTDEIEI